MAWPGGLGPVHVNVLPGETSLLRADIFKGAAGMARAFAMPFRALVLEPDDIPTPAVPAAEMVGARSVFKRVSLLMVGILIVAVLAISIAVNRHDLSPALGLILLFILLIAPMPIGAFIRRKLFLRSPSNED